MCKKIVKSMYFMGCLMMTVLLFCGCTRKSDLVIETNLQQQNVPVTKNENSDSDVGPETIYVQVIGAVHNPGVYELSEDARVFEAIEMAGGMTEDAAPDSLNQAKCLTDGEMIVLYTMQEWDAACKSGQSFDDVYGNGISQETDDRININTADMDVLCTIPGIGETRAKSIITYREENGAFGSIDEIKNVSGIKDGLFQKVKDRIKTE